MLARAFPRGGDRGEVVVGEGAEFGPDTGVEDSDDDVIGVGGGGPEAVGVGEAEEGRCVGGVGVADLVRGDGEDGRVTAEVGGGGGCEAGGEAGGGGCVCVEDGGG